MYSKFLKAIVWIQKEGFKVPYPSKVYGEYSVRKDKGNWVVSHNSSGLSVKICPNKKYAEKLCIELEETMVETWDGNGIEYVPYEFRNELQNILYTYNN